MKLSRYQLRRLIENSLREQEENKPKKMSLPNRLRAELRNSGVFDKDSADPFAEKTAITAAATDTSTGDSGIVIITGEANKKKVENRLKKVFGDAVTEISRENMQLKGGSHVMKTPSGKIVDPSTAKKLKSRIEGKQKDSAVSIEKYKELLANHSMTMSKPENKRADFIKRMTADKLKKAQLVGGQAFNFIFIKTS
jgi:hypothetical protein